MRPICVYHLLPIEDYPPCINFVNACAEAHNKTKLIVFSTKSNKGGKRVLFQAENVKIYRLGKISRNPVIRYLTFGIFYSISFLLTLWYRPRFLLYYETISSLAPLIYRTFNTGAKILVHYHEYVSPVEYRNSSLLIRCLHQWEKTSLSKFVWISHTNSDRMDFFVQDVGLNDRSLCHIVPNYPPSSWKTSADQQYPHVRDSNMIRFVYVGALSTETMYLREFVEWMLKYNTTYTLDIFSNNMSVSAEQFLQQLDNPRVILHHHLDYQEIPDEISRRHIGLVLYKGHIPNYIYNAPNKLFEYLACGLDVWFPHLMKGCFAYQETKAYPKVLKVDFENLDNENIPLLVSHAGLQERRGNYYSEVALEEFLNFLGNGSRINDLM